MALKSNSNSFILQVQAINVNNSRQPLPLYFTPSVSLRLSTLPSEFPTSRLGLVLSTLILHGILLVRFESLYSLTPLGRHSTQEQYLQVSYGMLPQASCRHSSPPNACQSFATSPRQPHSPLEADPRVFIPAAWQICNTISRTASTSSTVAPLLIAPFRCPLS